ncbi:hypothetical protein RFF05_09380 [Bengtsoniella intestinalis]|uniref:hypothetical protein n=1 Tax=Bengtsoniella intestinalis TaxID=3073143 RepID=UPI00391F3F29
MSQFRLLWKTNDSDGCNNLNAPLARSIPLVTQYTLGRGETSTALNIYIHSLPSSDKAAANKMNAILVLTQSFKSHAAFL